MPNSNIKIPSSTSIDHNLQHAASNTPQQLLNADQNQLEPSILQCNTLHPTYTSPTLRRDCINRPLPSSTCLVQRHFSIHAHTHVPKTTSGEPRSKPRPFRSRHLTRARQTRRRPCPGSQQPLVITVIIIIPRGGLSGQAVTASYRDVHGDGLGIGN